ncbi:hypothetical protein C8A01DRAFT_35417 [Parachaetomium inaequale]|uniref:Uncharacterized protein n=1 Tax=Parachaetomium inaequale TaxID=2588326 RepID=A0AAN6PL62_9PEZI|nr:hypothetical protein C8A01DRAFT_35417 [Parachaetomium inaequale]
MASPQENSEPSNSNDNSTHLIESLDGESRVQDALEREAPTTVRGAVSAAAFIIYVCTIMAYISLSPQGPGQGQDRFKVARLVAVAVWMVDSGVLFLCHARYLIRREIASAFLISALGLHYFVGAGGFGIADGVGVIMMCIVVAVLCPGLLGTMGMMGPGSAVE